MAVKHFFRGLTVERYRGLKRLDVDKFRRVNVVGGLNGSGKSTMLECLFGILDTYNAIAPVAPVIRRGIAVSMDEFIPYLYSGGEVSSPIKISTATRLGKVCLDIVHEKQPLDRVVDENNDALPAERTSMTSSNMGLTIRYSRDNTLVDVFHYVGKKQNLNVMTEHGTKSVFPQAVYLNRNNFATPQEGAGLLTKVLQAKGRNRVVDILKTIEPTVTSVQVLQLSNVAHVAAEFEDGSFLPMNLLSGGASSLLAICLAIMTSRDGVVLLDEFDASFHYSRLEHVWREIATLSLEYNCQIFAATHSSECIKAAASALRCTNTPEDILYIRLNKQKFSVKATNYVIEEIEAALEDEWELR